MHKKYLLSLLLPWVLASCNDAAGSNQNTQPPLTVEGSTETVTKDALAKPVDTSNPAPAKLEAQAILPSTMRTYFTDIRATTVIRTPGLPDQVTTTPSGLTAGYLFTGNQVKTRLNIPGSMFPDNRAHILLYDSTQQAARIVYADTLAPDPDVTPSDIASFLNTLVNTSKSNDALPKYASRTADQYRSGLSALSLTPQDTYVTVNNVSTHVLQSTKSMNTANSQQTTTSSFDPNIGLVVQATSKLNTSEATQQATTDYSYQMVAGLSNVRWPSTLHTNLTMTAKTLGTTATGTQDVTFTNGQANTLADSYFNIGGL